MRGWRGVAAAALAALALGGCHDFSADLEACRAQGRCGAAPVDGPGADAGGDAGSDAGPDDAGPDDAGPDDAGPTETAARVCNAAGWCWRHPELPSNALYGLWTDGAEVVAVGAQGVVLHTDGGSAWSATYDPAGRTLTAVQGDARGWTLAGHNGRLVTWLRDGGVVDDSTRCPLCRYNDLFAAQEQRVAVGTEFGQGPVAVTSDAGAAFFKTPLSGASEPYAVDGHGLELWAVGSQGGVRRRDAARVWSAQPVPAADGGVSDEELYGVWANTDGGVWLGARDAVFRRRADGAGFERLALPGLTRALQEPSPGTLVVAGDVEGLRTCTVGGACERVAEQPPDTGFYRLARAPDGRLLAVGGHGAVMERSAQGAWAPLREAPTRVVWGVAPRADGGAVAVGGRALVLLRGADGTWTPVAQQDLNSYNDVYVDAQGRTWASGESIHRLGDDGVAGAPVLEWPAGTPYTEVKALGGVGDDAWGATERGGVVRLGADGQWRLTHAPGTDGLLPYALWASDAGVALVGGADATLYATDGGALTPVGTPTPLESIYGIWGSSPTDYWVVGQGTQVLHVVDGTRTALTVPSTPDVFAWHAVGGTGPDDVWVAADTAVARWNGSAWTVTRSGSNNILRDVLVTGSRVWAVGDGETVLELKR